MPAVSKNQRKLMGWAYAVRKAGKKSKKWKEAPEKIRDLAYSMSKKDLKKYAETKHKGLPKKVKESYFIKSFDNFINS